MLVLHKITTSTVPHIIPRTWQPIRNRKAYSELGKALNQVYLPLWSKLQSMQNIS